MAEIIEFPNKPMMFDEFLQAVLLLSANPVESAVAVIRVGGRDFPLMFNVDAAGLAFYALMFQREAMIAGDLIPDPDMPA